MDRATLAAIVQRMALDDIPTMLAWAQSQGGNPPSAISWTGQPLPTFASIAQRRSQEDLRILTKWADFVLSGGVAANSVFPQPYGVASPTESQLGWGL